MRIFRCTFLFLFLTALLRADVTLAPLFRDGVVLQRDKPLRVWGVAAPGEQVTVSFNEQHVAAATLPTGHWLAVLQPEGASSSPRELTVRGANTIVVHDVLVGDVWLCSGQSNMEFTVDRALNANDEIATADHPLIRHFKLPHAVASTPARDAVGEWVSCRPATVGEFSAVAYFFGRDLHARLGVPIGLINSSWGGTQIESWMSEIALHGDPAWPDILARWNERLAAYPAAVSTYRAQLAEWQHDAAAAQAARKPFTRRQPREPEGPGSRWQPAGLYNAMISPLVPFAMRGVIWYQGEENAARYGEYRRLFPTMIAHWRSDFAQGNLPFLFVQLANCNRAGDPTGEQWAFQREAQAAALALPLTGMAVTIDIGEPDNIHPKNKQEVGRRLALLAFNRVYGLGGVDEGPTFESATREGDLIRLHFRSTEGLYATDPRLPGFELAGADGVFLAASASIENDTVLLTPNRAGSRPVAVRYAWFNTPLSSLANATGLPAAPFRADIP